MKISKALLAYEPEVFKTTFGFKGNKLNGVWQSVAYLGNNDAFGIGLGVQSVLWSDANVFVKYGEDTSNKMMLDVTQEALHYIEGASFANPSDLIQNVFPHAYKYAVKTTNMNVSETFVLNALVPVDFAAWMLYSRENGYDRFSSIFDTGHTTDKLANIPLITYNTSIEDVIKMANDGVCIFKIKIGSDPDGDGDLSKMLAWDKARALAIHNALKDIHTDYTDGGRIVYYFDANGRYDTKANIREFIEFLDPNGILKQTVLFEEPFSYDNKLFVGDLPVCFAADESAHSLKDVKERIDLGYKAITLKPIAKTLSVSIDMAKCAMENNVQCFCADLTVNPVMVEWNKNFASRVKPLNGMKIGVVESNGAQNYINWDLMCSYNPYKYGREETSIYTLDDRYNKNAGGVFITPEHYLELINSQN